MIQMKKEHCIICNGSGWYAPYPYHRRKKCDHQYNRGGLQFKVDQLTEEQNKIQQQLDKYIIAINTSEEV